MLTGEAVNINGLTLNNLNGKRALDVQSTPKERTQGVSQNTGGESTGGESQDQVHISQEGKGALNADKDKALSSNLGSTLFGQHSESAQKAKEAEEEKAMTPIDKQIQRVKEQLEELQARLTELEGDNSEAAENERKLIQDQILELTGVLMSLIEKKARDAKTESTST